MKRVGFIGVGIMGSSMVRNLMKDGHEVHIYARNKEKVEQVIADGAVFHDTIAECVKGRDAVITIVGYPQDVEDVISWRRQDPGKCRSGNVSYRHDHYQSISGCTAGQGSCRGKD